MRTRYFPKGAMIVRPKQFAGVEIGLYASGGTNVGAIAYCGKRRKPDFFLSFKSDERRRNYVSEYLSGLAKAAVRREEKKAKRVLETNPVKVGDIFYASWGWEQTNIDYYKVSEVKGMFVTLREMMQDRTYDGDMSGNCVPTNVPKPDGETLRKRVQTYNGGETVYVSLASYKWCGLWDGKPKGWSSYA